MNQLQKDIKIALSWKAFLPYEKTYTQDNETFKRLEQFINQDTEIYCKKEMQEIIQEQINNERTALGKMALKQLLEKTK